MITRYMGKFDCVTQETHVMRSDRSHVAASVLAARAVHLLSDLKVDNLCVRNVISTCCHKAASSFFVFCARSYRVCDGIFGIYSLVSFDDSFPAYSHDPSYTNAGTSTSCR